jgi:hypothetical protein
MANKLGDITINEVEIIQVDAVPSLGLGTAAQLGSIAILKDLNSTVGRIYLKFGNANTAWRIIPTNICLCRVNKTITSSIDSNVVATGDYFFNGSKIFGDYVGHRMNGFYSIVSASISSRKLLTKNVSVILKRRTGIGTWSNIANFVITILNGQYWAVWSGQIDLQENDEITAFCSDGGGDFSYPILTLDLIPTENLQ